MKLKKIASLMLAGIMAVSMLAGCATASNNGNGGEGEGEGQGQVSTSNSSSILHDAMVGNARKMTTPTASSALDTALKNAVDTYFQNTDYAYIIAFDNVVEADGAMYDALVKAMDAKKNINPNLYADANNSKVTTAVKMYVVEASVSDTYALEKVADEIQGSVAGLPETSANGEWNYTYTISASIVTKPVTSSIVEGVTGGVKYIAVAVTQTPAAVV